MADPPISRTALIAVLVASTAALVARSWLRVQLLQNGMEAALAADLSYLVVPPILLLLLFPLWRTEKAFLKDQFRRRDLTWRVVAIAIAIGVLMRLMWWSQLIAGTSFGVYKSADPDAVVGPVFSFQCASPEVVFLGFVVMAILTPLIEEIVHRGYILTVLQQRRVIASLVISAAIFALMHRMSTWPFAFFAGLVFAVQYSSTRSLWPSLIAHATFNGLAQLDWRCLSGSWNPRPESIPVIAPGIASLFVLAGCALLLFILLRKMAAEARALRPGRPPPKRHSRLAR